MPNTADMIRGAKMMTGTTGAGAGKAVTDEDVARLRRMMAERGMSDMEKSNATTDMGAEKAGMLKKLMQMMGRKKGMMGGGMVKKYKGGGSVKGGFPDLTGDGKVTQKDILKGRGVKGMMDGGDVKKVKKYRGGGCVMPGRGKSRAMMKK